MSQILRPSWKHKIWRLNPSRSLSLIITSKVSSSWARSLRKRLRTWPWPWLWATKCRKGWFKISPQSTNLWSSRTCLQQRPQCLPPLKSKIIRGGKAFWRMPRSRSSAKDLLHYPNNLMITVYPSRSWVSTCIKSKKAPWSPPIWCLKTSRDRRLPTNQLECQRKLTRSTTAPQMSFRATETSSMSIWANSKRHPITRVAWSPTRNLKSHPWPRERCRLYKIWQSMYCLKIKTRLLNLETSMGTSVLLTKWIKMKVMAHKLSFCHLMTRIRWFRRGRVKPSLTGTARTSKWRKQSSLTTNLLSSLGKSNNILKNLICIRVPKRGPHLILKLLRLGKIRAHLFKQG